MVTLLEVEQKTQTEKRQRHRDRAQMFGVTIDVVSMQDTVEIIQDWCATSFDLCRYVVTPNVDHVVMLRQHDGLKAAYRDADLVIADGWPVVAASRLVGKPLPERVPGSDLVPLLMKTASPKARRTSRSGRSR